MNPISGEEKAHSSNDKYRDQNIDQCKKQPLPADSPVPPPKGWSLQGGMVAPESTGPKPDLIIDQELPNGTVRGNKLPPLTR